MMSAPKKKARIFLYPYKPPALSGVLAASKSASVLDDEYVSRVNVTRVGRAEVGKIFFPDTSTEVATVAATNAVVIGSHVAAQLKKSGISEEYIRNAVFTDLLKNHDISFPTSAIPEKTTIRTRLRKAFTRVECYQEKSLAAVLNECHETLLRQDAREEEEKEEEEKEEEEKEEEEKEEEEEEGVLIVDRLLQGLNVTTSSLPDMTVLRGGSLYFGEFKNSRKYTNEHAAKQCTLYLYALLYFFRVQLGRPIKAVFGFFVCGRDCFIEDEYTVGLVRLSAPTKLGESPVSEVFLQICPTRDMSGLKFLVNFLKAGKTIEFGNSVNSIHPSKRIPALLTLPESLWKSNNLVRNGTASMVFNGNPQDILSVLDQVDVHNNREWLEFRGEVNAYFEGLEMTADGPRFYLKLRLMDTTLRPFPASALRRHWGADERINALYCVKPFGCEQLGVFLMHDRGTVLIASQELDLDVTGFLALFRELWSDTMLLSTNIFHGDALPHNMAYDGEKLTLIDLDEGVTNNMAPKRNVKPANSGLYAYLLYPNMFRAWENRVLYTQLQLVASFLLMIQPFESDIMGDARESLSRLQEAATSANKFIMDNSNAEPKFITDNLRNDPRVKLVVLRLETILLKCKPINSTTTTPIPEVFTKTDDSAN